MYNTQTQASILTRSALMIAFTAVCSWISIPIPGTSVPINLATFAVILAGLVLGPKDGALAILAFLALGACGLPVFHSFTGGMGIVFGPTGGFLIGYVLLAFLAGLGGRGDILQGNHSASACRELQESEDTSLHSGQPSSLQHEQPGKPLHPEQPESRTRNTRYGNHLRYALFVLLGEIALYALGCAWFIAQAGSNLETALLSCVLPFIPGDIAKIILAYIAAGKLRNIAF